MFPAAATCFDSNPPAACMCMCVCVCVLRARARMLRLAQHARCSDAWITQQVKRGSAEESGRTGAIAPVTVNVEFQVPGFKYSCSSEELKLHNCLQ